MTPFITDRTSIETDWTCPRKRYWMLHFGGQGIVPVNTPDALRDGIEIHEALASLIEGRVLELPPMPTGDDITQSQLETWARKVGWLVAFHEWFWPLFAAHYEVVAIEQEMVLERDGIWVAFTADLILRNRETGKLVIIDFKSVGWLTKEWAESWPFAVQLHLNIIGASEELQEPVSHGLVVGLQKGKTEHGKLRHPYVWAYSDGERWQTGWKSGWGLRPVWEYGSGGAEGIREWVLSLGPEVGLGQFPISQPIVADPDLVEELIRDRKAREEQVASWVDGLSSLPETFPRAFKSCKPSLGSACDYLHACHNQLIGEDPIGSELFKVRIPHHDILPD